MINSALWGTRVWYTVGTVYVGTGSATVVLLYGEGTHFLLSPSPPPPLLLLLLMHHHDQGEQF